MSVLLVKRNVLNYKVKDGGLYNVLYFGEVFPKTPATKSWMRGGGGVFFGRYMPRRHLNSFNRC